LLTESAVLAVVGGLLGTLLAWQGVRLLVQLDPGRIPRLDEARIDIVVLLFSLAVSVLAGLLFGLAPALQQWRAAPQEALRAGGRGMVGETRGWMRRALVMAEVAMALVILIGAGLLVRSFAALQRVDPGFDARGVATFQLALPRSRYDSTDKLRAFYLDLTARLAALPGVERASAGYPLPMSEEGWSGSFYQEGVTIAPGDPEPHAEYATVLPGYFRAMNIPLLSGRDFTDGDAPGAGRVAVVDEALVARYFPGQSPLGRRIGIFDNAEQAMATIVGVVGHVHNAGPQSEGEPQIYLPYLQQTQGLMYAVVRGRLPGQPSPAELRAAVRALDAELPVSRLRPLAELAARALAPTRFNALLLAIFAVVALVLASVGLYGVMSFLVTQRAQEIGIRMALGGHPRDVLRLVMRQGLSIAGAGIFIGLAAAMVLVRLASALLFGVGTTDVPTYLGVSLLLVLVALVACYIPGRRATLVDPVSTMRS
jgi:putative ABC transport system permease protein